jgi:hypothetical protein
MKITKYKIQNTNKLQIRNYKLQTLLLKQNTDYSSGVMCWEAWYYISPYIKISLYIKSFCGGSRGPTAWGGEAGAFAPSRESLNGDSQLPAQCLNLP